MEYKEYSLYLGVQRVAHFINYKTFFSSATELLLEIYRSTTFHYSIYQQHVGNKASTHARARVCVCACAPVQQTLAVLFHNPKCYLKHKSSN